ncbi:MAG: hypothetical protein AB9903_26880 [Vulcanimicrobiota bacterium]
MTEADDIGILILKRVCELSLAPSIEPIASVIEKDIIKEFGFCKVNVNAYLLYLESKGLIKKIKSIEKYMIRLKGIEAIKLSQARI